jgi:hypothetical protein
MSVVLLGSEQNLLISLAWFAPEWVAYFAPESVAYFGPEYLAYFTPE